MSESYSDIESRIQEALDALSERDRPNIAVAAREFRVPEMAASGAVEWMFIEAGAAYSEQETQRRSGSRCLPISRSLERRLARL